MVSSEIVSSGLELQSYRFRSGYRRGKSGDSGKSFEVSKAKPASRAKLRVRVVKSTKRGNRARTAKGVIFMGEGAAQLGVGVLKTAIAELCPKLGAITVSSVSKAEVAQELRGHEVRGSELRCSRLPLETKGGQKCV